MVGRTGSDGGTTASRPSPWPVLRGFHGYQISAIGPDVLAGLTLAAIAIPEQMATARLAGLPERQGFFAFIAGSLAVALLGVGRRLSAGADSTITPIFAGALALLAAAGSPHFITLASGLAMMVGALVLAAGILKLGWIGNLLSIPVTNGFLAGIAVHIIASQAPAALGVPGPSGPFPQVLLSLAAAIPHGRPAAMLIAGGVLAATAVCHWLSPRLPGPLIAVAAATFAASTLPAGSGVALLGVVQGGLPTLGLPALDASDAAALLPLALLVSVVVMGQTAATDRAFEGGTAGPDIGGDFIGLGAGSLLSGLMGAFPVNASPPRTAVVAESGGRSPLAGLVAAAVVGALLAWATGWLRGVPTAALSGVLLFVAARLVRGGQILAVARASPVEGLLILATAAAMVILPIASGVAVGVTLSLLHGAWSSARVKVTPLRRIRGTTVWWPPIPGLASEEDPAAQPAVVLGFAAPLTFLNAESFVRQFFAEVTQQAGPQTGKPRLVVLEAAGLVEIDYTGAQALRQVVMVCRTAGRPFAVARLEALAAQSAFRRFGLINLIGEQNMFQSVAAAIEALASVDTKTPPL